MWAVRSYYLTRRISYYMFKTRYNDKDLYLVKTLIDNGRYSYTISKEEPTTLMTNLRDILIPRKDTFLPNKY